MAENALRGKVEFEMPNPADPEHPKLYRLVYDMDALEAAEGALGLSLMQISQVFADLTVRTARVMFWAGRLHYEPELKLKDVGPPEGMPVMEWVAHLALHCRRGLLAGYFGVTDAQDVVQAGKEFITAAHGAGDRKPGKATSSRSRSGKRRKTPSGSGSRRTRSGG